MKIKGILGVLIAMLLYLAIPAEAFASNYPGYIYSYDKEAHPSPLPYASSRTFDGKQLKVGAFRSPNDIFIDKDGALYIADTGNHRIIIIDQETEQARVIDSFQNNGTEDHFNEPQGVFVDPENGHIFVADTLNRRIVELTKDGSLVNTVEEPKSSLIRTNFQFAPIKLVLDKAKRMYVVSKGAYEGLMEFDGDGKFVGFIGTNRVKFNPVDLLWKRISTEEQREQMVLFVPLEFNNVDIDEHGFMYTTTSEVGSNELVKRLNPSGVDILRREGFHPPKGDIQITQTGSVKGGSTFIDVVSERAGIYNALDFKRGRIFSYDKDGHLLYQFGGIGSQLGRFKAPSALDSFEDNIYVSDRMLGTITVFEPTVYGKAVRKAVTSHYDGNMEQAAEAWNETLRLNRNNEIAYIGLGKALLKQDRYAEAMAHFELGNNRSYYSEAFKRNRELWLERNFGYMAGAIALAAAAYMFVRKRFRTATAVHYTEMGIWKNPFYTAIHPFNGFWEMKYEQKGKVGIAFGILLGLFVAIILKRQFSGFIVNYNDVSEFNSFNELKFVVIPFLLWCVANWSLTTLMEGEGSFKDIIMATGYALLPLIIVYLPQLALSHVVTAEESSFYYLLNTVAVLWSLWLLFVGTMTVHQYTPGKTIVTMLLTIVMIGIILFLSLLLFSVMQQMLSFAISIYNEIIFRM
ncbi:YIP1 family protein [Paenibacillus sp. LHD-38]|uniref:YIP1 family protein n=1 Tax=Paenibacillus sp. LHD-38 TaxID=3072143 RepID=UPI00280F29A2|nr:YIP1 family protein [Paenibacillus sp. LHD-38]MDQ8734504.1 YIP1 family protein [Paenibacillus sp. LHD-38]